MDIQPILSDRSLYAVRIDDKPEHDLLKGAFVGTTNPMDAVRADKLDLLPSDYPQTTALTHRQLGVVATFLAVQEMGMAMDGTTVPEYMEAAKAMVSAYLQEDPSH